LSLRPAHIKQKLPQRTSASGGFAVGIPHRLNVSLGWAVLVYCGYSGVQSSAAGLSER